jgi:hypothetical protein
MTHTMMFDRTMEGGRERLSPLGEVWSRWMRALVSLLRSESATASGAPPPDDDEAVDEPVAPQAAAERGGRLTLASAYDVELYRPTYEPLLQPEPKPNSQPPDEPDPPPSGYTHVSEIDGVRRPWPAVLLAVLRRIFGATPLPLDERKG